MNNNNNFNTENFFGLQNIEALLQSIQTGKIGNKIGKEFADAIEKAIIEKDPFEAGLKGYDKSLKEIRSKMEQTFKDVKFDSSIKNSINSTLDKADKQLLSLKQRFADVYAAIEKENKKSDKDLNKMMQLTQQLYSIQNEYNLAQATTVENVNILVSENELQIQQTQAIAQNEAIHRQEAELLLEKKKLIGLTNEDEIKALQKKISLDEADLNIAKSKLQVQRDLVSKTENNISSQRSNVANIKSNINSESDYQNQVFSEGKAALNDLNKETTSTFLKWKNGITAIGSEVTKMFDLWNQLFNATEKRIESLNQEFGERWKIRNDISKNIGGADFNEYQKDIYNSATSGSMRGMYNEKELKEHLVSMSEYLFETKEAAIENSHLIAYGNKFLGMSNESMKSLYNLEKMTNGDGFIRSQLQTITKLQNSGLVTSQAQLDQLTVLAANTTRELSELGLKEDAAQTLTNSMTEVSAVLDSKMYAGAGQEFQNKLVAAFKNPDTAGVELFGSNLVQATQILNSNDPDKAWKLLELAQNSGLSQKTRELSANGYSLSSAVAGQQFENAGWFNAVGSNWSQIQADRSMIQSMGYEDYLAKSEKTDSSKVDERTKWLNEKAVDLANGQYDTLVEQAMSTERIESYVQHIERTVNIIAGALGVLGGLQAGGKVIGKFFGGKSGAGGISSLFGGGAEGTGGGLLSKLSIGKATGGSALMGVGLTAAGLGWAAYDGISGGMNGITDENGNYIMEKGWGTGLTTAIGGKNVNTEAYHGNLTAHAKESNMLGSMGSGAAKGALIGAGIGTFFGPGIGTAIGGAIGGLVGGIAGLFAGNKKNKEAEEYAKKQYEELKRQTEIDNEMLEIAKRGNAALAYRYAIDTSIQGGLGGSYPAMGDISDAMGSNKQDVKATGLLQSPWGCSRGFEYSTKYVDGKPTNEKTLHQGIDLTAPSGTPIGAAMGGTVIFAGWKNNGGGNQTWIKGDDGLEYWYLHQVSEPPVTKDQKVRTGDTIGYVGSTGNSSGPHLHFAVKRGSQFIEPIGYINPSIFNASGVPSISNISSNDLYESSKLLESGTMRTAARTHYIAAGGPNVSSGGGSSIDISPIVEGLNTVNNTIKELGDRQDAQQRILDALTVKPIPSLGI